ncbi:DUF2993 domain-containing protein [Corynebacterium pygosceleis]|uniref:DUF2993 domain-containing protein n=1 Tax=Corynebacterium pygosceleis TaxID=2800406 RepID=A0A9Q4GIC1_9CORY|nr:DUF2993 domain-containing protein [Corynebacterium pygosceleis]MCK7637413.1 DUF2993 domain-containing protein [Corynebacterium pygosceleis]MCK7676063.1 DUF2993 domain-containing protein [Corynebacterium pygosceleis]MCL0119811.1 DUF2993 domain-containing protein [Corynebacterium pygosceleis]MCX7468258.1 DUF2993 domain-containing protein [Corynebacterium pygosceleis]
MSSSVSKKRGSVWWKILLGIVISVFIILLVAEIALRMFISKQLEDDFAEQTAMTGVVTDRRPEIGFGPVPLLLSVASGTVPSVDVSTPSTLQITHPEGINSDPDIKGTPASDIHITDLALRGPEGPVAGRLTVQTDISDDMMLAQVQAAMHSQTRTAGDGLAGSLLQNLVKVTDITPDPETDTLDIEFTDGAAHIVIRPTAVDGQLQMEATEARLFGFALPDEISGAISRALRSSAADLGGGMSVDVVTVRRGGMHLEMSGENVNLRDMG